MRISDWSSDVCSSDLRIPEKLPKGERRPVFDQCRHDCFPLHHCPARQTHRTKARFLQPNPPHQRWGGGPPPKAVVEGSAQRALKPPPVNLQPLPNTPHHLIQTIHSPPTTRQPLQLSKHEKTTRKTTRLKSSH